MIKNLLYSLFLHFILLLSIYLSFNLKPVKKTNENEVLISLVKMSPYKPVTKEKKVVPEQIQTAENDKPQEQSKEEAIRKEEILKKKTVKKNESKTKKQTPQKTKPKKTAKPLKKKPKPLKKSIKPPIKQENTTQKEKPTKTIEEKATELNNLDLSVREKLNMRSQLKRCYSRAIREADFSSKTMLSIVIQIDEYGYIDSNLDSIVDEKRYNDPEETNYKLAVDNIRRTINLCSPLRNLPADKYDVWKKITLDFGSIKGN